MVPNSQELIKQRSCQLLNGEETEELTAALLVKTSYEFSALFQAVHERLRARQANSGGDDMLRLRVYEKLQDLVSRGLVKKNAKKYAAN